MRRFWGLLAVSALIALLGCSMEEPAVPQTSQPQQPDHHMLDQPDKGMSKLEQLDFSVGRSFFRNPWVQAPASTDARDGLGPLFNANSCSACHIGSGRGLSAMAGQPLKTHVLRLSVPSLAEGFIADVSYGQQLQGQALPGIKPEGQVMVSFVSQTQKLDGEEITLRAPKVELVNLAYGPLPENVSVSLRMAPQLAGLGLLASVSEQQLLAWADPDDADGDGISGRANQVWDMAEKAYRMGRFGWKAEQPSVKQQTAMAFHADLGISSSFFPEQNCSTVQKVCRQQVNGGEPEISDHLLDRVTLYASNLAVPKVKAGSEKGRALFYQAGCAKCHRPQLLVETSTFPWLAGRRISPYTDLLLHDMGEGLADNRPVGQASGREWKTPPLWGIGAAKKVTPGTGFLHDGRADSLLEAILWHGGEAETSQRAVMQMSNDERDALLTFIESL